MLNIRPLIEQHIRTQIPAFKEVSGAANLASILSSRMSDKGCYVFQDRKSPKQNESISGVVQEIELSFAHVIVVLNVKDAMGGDAADVSAEFQNSLQEKLLNWTPDANFTEFVYSGGALVSFTGGLHIWRDSYTTRTFI